MMNVKREPVVVTLSSPSLLPNNLSAVPSLAARHAQTTPEKTHFAIVHHIKAGVFATRLSSGFAGVASGGDAARSQMGNLLNFQEYISKDSGSKPCAAPLTQVSFVDMAGQSFLVITSYKGIQMYSKENEMVMWHALSKSAPSDGIVTANNFARGITAVDNTLYIGTSSGDILTFAASGGTTGLDKFTMGKTLSGSSVHSGNPITDLHSCPEENPGQIVSADEDGKIVVWKNNSVAVECKCKYSDDPCNSVRLRGPVIAGGFCFGKIRLFSSASGLMQCEIDAHSKSISAIDLSPDMTLLSASEDTFFRLWKVHTASDDQLDVDMAHSACMENMTLTGCCFLTRSQFALAAYDYNEIHVFSIS